MPASQRHRGPFGYGHTARSDCGPLGCGMAGRCSASVPSEGSRRRQTSDRGRAQRRVRRVAWSLIDRSVDAAADCHRADEAMYAAKAGGRNRIECVRRISAGSIGRLNPGRRPGWVGRAKRHGMSATMMTDDWYAQWTKGVLALRPDRRFPCLGKAFSGTFLVPYRKKAESRPGDRCFGRTVMSGRL